MAEPDIWGVIEQRASAPAPEPAEGGDPWAAIAQRVGAPAPAGYPKQILHGLARGMAALPGIPGDIAQLEAQGLGALGAPETAGWLQRNVLPPPSAAFVGAAERNVIGPRPPATSPGAQFAGDVATYVPSALLGGPEGLLGRAGLAAASGAASEGARAAGLPAPAQVAAGLLPGLAAGGARMLGTPSQVAVRPAARDIPELRWAEGAALEKAGREVGVPLMAHEALAPEVAGGSPLTQLAGDIRATPKGGAIISRVIETRPAAVTAAAKRATATIGPEMSAPAVLSAVKDVASRAISTLDRERTTATTRLYQAADPVHIPTEAVTPIIAQVDEALAAAPARGALRQGLEALRDQLHTASGSPQTLTSALSTAYKELRDKLGPAGLGDAGSLRSFKGTLNPINRSIQQALVENNPHYAEATARYRDLSAPLEALAGTRDNPSLVARVAEAGSNAELQRLLLDPENVSPGTVSQLAGMFDSAGRLDDLRGWMRHYLETSLNKASADLSTGTNPALGVNWRKLVYGNPAQREILDSYLTALDPTGGAGRGFSKLMTVLERTARTPGIGSPTAGRLQTAEAMAAAPVPTAAGLGAGAALGAAGLPTGAMAGGYVIGNKTVGFLRRQAQEMGSRGVAEALTAPDAVAKLRALAKRDPASTPALRSALAILSGRAANEKEPAK